MNKIVFPQRMRKGGICPMRLRTFLLRSSIFSCSSCALRFGSLITRGLEEAGMEVLFNNSLINLRPNVISFQPDLILLDLEVGCQNSREAIPRLKAEFSTVKVFIATSHTEGEEVSACLAAGADYYIKKPYQIQEILALIQRWIPDANAETQPAHYTLGNYLLNIETHALVFRPEQKATQLKPKEFQLLYLLLEHKNQVVNKNTILQRVWKRDSADDSLNNCISALRKALSQDEQVKIENLKGVGYLLRI